MEYRIIWRERVIDMSSLKFYAAGVSAAVEYCLKELAQLGCEIASQPDSTVTHLLLPAPAFEAEGVLKGGIPLQPVLDRLPTNITVAGGNLQDPILANYQTIDLLQDPLYLAENAQITAHCAVKAALQELPITLFGCNVLVIGWGRIGKCLASLLRQMGAYVTVAARKEADRAMILALGYDAMEIGQRNYSLVRYQVIFNTAPVMVLPADSLSYCRPDCILMDLASKPGIAGSRVIWARGLPGKLAPESSGKLMAKSILRLR